jgi:hypothetical protein
MVAQQNNLKTTSIFAFKHITKMHIHSSSIKNTEGFISEIKVAARVEHQTSFCGGFDITRSRDAPATSKFQIRASIIFNKMKTGRISVKCVFIKESVS